MEDRRVTHSGKDADGDITALCNPGMFWSPRSKADAIRDIEGRICRYHVLVGGQRAEVIVVTAPNGTKHLRTTADSTTRNNLDDLPDC